MSLRECYQLLGARPGCSPEAIKAAFRRKLLIVHPDRNPDDPFAAERTRQLLEAYRSVLSHTRVSTAQRAAETTPARPDRSATHAEQSCLSQTSAGIANALTALLALVLIVQLGLNAALRQRQLVFRPDPAAFMVVEPVRRLPIMPEPGITDYRLWYWTNRYQLTLGDTWVHRQLVRAYSLAESQARLRCDSNLLAFCRAALKHLHNTTTVHSTYAELFLSHPRR